MSQALLNLVKQISVEATGAITVFYGRVLPDESSATEDIGKMVGIGVRYCLLPAGASGVKDSTSH